MNKRKRKKQVTEQQKSNKKGKKELQYEIPKLVKIEGVGVTSGACINGSFAAIEPQ